MDHIGDLIKPLCLDKIICVFPYFNLEFWSFEFWVCKPDEQSI